MKPIQLKKIKASRIKEEDNVLLEDPIGGILWGSVIRIVQPKIKKMGDEKQRPSHLMTITTDRKRFRVLPTADLWIAHDEARDKKRTRRQRNAQEA